MKIIDHLQALFKSDKVDINLRFDLLTDAFTGTMSRFHKARDREHDRVVGLKLLDTDKTEAFEARFKALNKPAEGEIAVRLKHPRIVETYEYGVSTKGQSFIVMEYLVGPGLHTLIRLRDERLVGKRLPLVRQMAQALQAVHDAGFIHRNVCPRNFICTDDLSSLKLIDFGLTLPDEVDFRQPGNRTGTPAYMSPEVVRRRVTDRRVDVFAFGVTAYELLTFELPWPTADPTGQGALAHDTEPPVPIEKLRPDLNPTVARAVMRCLAANRDERPDSLDMFLQLIRKVETETA